MRRLPVDVPRAVLDTNVPVSALITPAGASATLLVELRAGAFELVDLARASRVDALVSSDARVLELRDRLPVKSPAEFLASLRD